MGGGHGWAVCQTRHRLTHIAQIGTHHAGRHRSVQIDTDRHRLLQIGTDRYRMVYISTCHTVQRRSAQTGTDRFRSLQTGADRLRSVQKTQIVLIDTGWHRLAQTGTD
jgi:hypothetical protein